MEKIYNKNGYSITDKSGKTRNITKEVLQKSLADMQKMLVNIQANIDILNEDLLQISNL